MLKKWVHTTQALHPDKRLRLWIQDEARFGQQGTITRVWAERGSRPVRVQQMEFEWVYLFGAVCPTTGRAHGCLMPEANTTTMSLYLRNFSKHLAQDEHALILLDRAGWHRSGDLYIPANVTLLLLPPYSPELNPAELLWWQMRDKHLSNQTFETVPILEESVADAWLQVIRDPLAVRSLCLFPWIQSALFN